MSTTTTPNQTDLIVNLDLRPDYRDADQIASAIKLGITTPELVAAVTGCEIVDGAVVVDGAWFADDGTGEIRTSAENGEDAAQDFAGTGEDDGRGRRHVIAAWQYAVDADGDFVHVNRDDHTIVIEPDFDE